MVDIEGIADMAGWALKRCCGPGAAGNGVAGAVAARDGATTARAADDRCLWGHRA
jgi:hypothetical protein